ncbi:MAG: bile acid:sodium symporter [Deltaproteobacteria bacterium]
MPWLLGNPVAMQVIAFLAHALFPAVVFAIGTTLTFREVGRELRRGGLLLRTLVVACVLIPLATAAVVKFLHVPLLLGGVMLIASVAPGDPFDLVEAKGKKGNLALASVLFPVLVLVMPFTVPVWLGLFSRWFPLHLTVSPRALFLEIAPYTLLPLVLGLACREWIPAGARVLARAAEMFARVAIVVLLAAFLWPALSTLAKFDAAAFTAIFLAVSFSLWAGYRAGGQDRRDGISVGVTAALGNLAAIVLVTHACYPGVHVWNTALAYVIVRWVVFKGWYLFLRRRMASTPVTPSSRASPRSS